MNEDDPRPNQEEAIEAICAIGMSDWNQSGLELQAPEFDPALYQDQPDSVP